MFKLIFSTEIQIYWVVFKHEVGQKGGGVGAQCAGNITGKPEM